MNRFLGFAITLVILLGFVFGFLKLRKAFSEGPQSVRDAMKRFAIITREDSIDGIVSFIYCPPKVRCASSEWTYIIFDDSSERSLHVSHGLDSLEMRELIKPGSQVFKRPGNDTVLVSDTNNPRNFLRFVISK